MKITTRGLAAAVVLTGCAIGLASPASAELTDGTYEMTYPTDGDGPPPRTIVVTSCGAGCIRTQVAGPYNADEWHLQGDTWTAMANGSVKTINNNTLAGTANNLVFQLTKIG